MPGWVLLVLGLGVACAGAGWPVLLGIPESHAAQLRPGLVDPYGVCRMPPERRWAGKGSAQVEGWSQARL